MAKKDYNDCSIEFIENEISLCKFTCKAGPLENHTGYMALLKRAKSQAERLEREKMEREVDYVFDVILKNQKAIMRSLMGTAFQASSTELLEKQICITNRMLGNE